MFRSVAVLLTCGVMAYAQPNASAGAVAAAEWVEARRNEIRRGCTDDPKRCIEQFQSIVHYLQTDAVREMSQGSQFLRWRAANTYVDLAVAHLEAGDRPEALRWLGKFAEWSPGKDGAAFLENLSGLALLRGDANFKSMIQSMRNGERLWNSEVWKSKFNQNLTDTEKIAGLSRFWSEVKFNFAYPSKLIELDWDRAYQEWIPKVLATKSTREYYMELLKLCALLKDGHTNVIPPEDLDLYSKPALRTEMIEGKPVIAEVYSPALAAEDVRAGLEIVRIDGVPVLDYARSRVEPYVSASSPQDLRRRVFRYGLLNGRRTDPVRLTLRDQTGREYEKTLARGPYPDAKYPPLFSSRREGSVSVVRINGFDSKKAVEEWKKAWPEIRSASALVLDLRDNGGGSQSIGDEILRDLIRKPTLRSSTRVRTYRPVDRVLGLTLDWDESPGGEVRPNPEPFAGNVTVLAGPGTFSAAEDFLVAFKLSGRGRVVGETTAGSTGLPLYFDLPGGGHARVCTKQDRWPDGTEWVGKGIEPDVHVKQTLSDLRAGRDTVFSFALR